MAVPDFSNLSACVEDARQAGLDLDPGPADPVQYHQLRGRLLAVRSKIPPLYRETAFEPFVRTLDQIGESGFNQILLEDPDREGLARLVLDAAQAFLQLGEGFEPKARAAFQEVVSDLYDGFLSAEDRRGVEPPELGTIPPLIKFGVPEFGPYTFTVPATANLGMEVAIVNLPPANARRGLFAWPALGHETAGHDILHADNGLLEEVSGAVRAALLNDADTQGLANYWATRIDETASDVLGILNMGPAAGIGLIGFFRGLNAAFTGNARLRNAGSATDPHPADILRGFLAAEAVRQLEFAQAADWANAIEAETMKDVTTIVLEGRTVPANVAKKSAEIVARVIVSTPMHALEEHAFEQIQNWRDRDEEIVQRLTGILTTAKPLPSDLTVGVFAAHLVAAATVAALASGANIALLFQRMLDLLKSMNDKNPSFGPLFIKHPGDIALDRVYVLTDEQVAEVAGVVAAVAAEVAEPEDRSSPPRRRRA